MIIIIIFKKRQRERKRRIRGRFQFHFRIIYHFICHFDVCCVLAAELLGIYGICPAAATLASARPGQVSHHLHQLFDGDLDSFIQ